MNVLSQKFFNRPAEKVARDLLGKVLRRKIGVNILRGVIIETEAYIGPKDKASHAHKGKTERNKPMFGSAGCWYIYFVYGVHWMLNIVTGPQNFPAAVLIRGVKTSSDKLLNGPAKLTKFFKIDKKFNGKQSLPKNLLWIEENGNKNLKNIKIERLPRVGVDYAGEIWAKKLLRFKLKC